MLLQLTAITAITAIATETCGKTFKILLQSTTWNCGSEKSTQSSEVCGVWWGVICKEGGKKAQI